MTSDLTKTRRRRNLFYAIVLIQIFIIAYIGRGGKRMSEKEFSYMYPESKLDNISTKSSFPLRKIAQPITVGLPHDPCGYLVRSPFEGRLGNQMFMYASFYGIMRKQKKVNKTSFLWSPPGSFTLDRFFANLTLARKNVPGLWFDRKGFTWIGENGCCNFDGNWIGNLACDGKNFIVRGFRQSFKYFVDSINEIKKEFQFKLDIKNRGRKMLDETLISNNINRSHCVCVGVHMRRGDFTGKLEKDVGHWPAELEYFQRAIRFYETFHFGTSTSNNISTFGLDDNPNCLAFLIFGDDYEWNFNATYQVQLIRPNNSRLIVMDVRKSQPAVDLYAMSFCDHMIISTGTFSWWAGFFSPGMVTYQKRYARSGSTHYREYKIEDYFLPNWIGL